MSKDRKLCDTGTLAEPLLVPTRHTGLCVGRLESQIPGPLLSDGFLVTLLRKIQRRGVCSKGSEKF